MKSVFVVKNMYNKGISEDGKDTIVGVYADISDIQAEYGEVATIDPHSKDSQVWDIINNPELYAVKHDVIGS